MNWIDILTTLGAGGVLMSLVQWVQNRRQVAANAEKIEAEADGVDVDTKLAYLGAVIDRLDADNARLIKERDHALAEVTLEQQRTAVLRQRVRELEDEIDVIGRSARETQRKCDELSYRLKEFVNDVQEKRA